MFSNVLRRNPHLQSLRTDLSASYQTLENLKWPAKCYLCGLFMFLIAIIAVAVPRGTETHCSRCPPSSNEHLSPRLNSDLTPTSITHESDTKVIFAHLRMAKTPGNTINGLLAHSYERVCGHKGYSYDAHQANQRHKEAGGGHVMATRDSFTEFHGAMNRLRVPGDTMNEIGFEDCDWISLEGSWTLWPPLVNTFTAHNFTVEMHVPCRDPVEHLMSSANYHGKVFDCRATDLKHEVERCGGILYRSDRFSKELAKVDGLTLQCFDLETPHRYIEYMGNALQRKRIDGGGFVPRLGGDDVRDKSGECIWSEDNQEVMQQVVGIMMKSEYFLWCQECLGSDRDLFSHSAL